MFFVTSACYFVTSAAASVWCHVFYHELAACFCAMVSGETGNTYEKHFFQGPGMVQVHYTHIASTCLSLMTGPTIHENKMGRFDFPTLNSCHHAAHQ